MNTLKPSTFTRKPLYSLTQKSEAERVASHINIIRKRLGDNWDITREQYRKERIKDGEFSEGEMYLFDEVIKLIPDAIGCIGFSKVWTEAARTAAGNEPPAG